MASASRRLERRRCSSRPHRRSVTKATASVVVVLRRIEQDVWSPLIRQVVEAVPPDERAGAFDLLVFSCCLLQRILSLIDAILLSAYVAAGPATHTDRPNCSSSSKHSTTHGALILTRSSSSIHITYHSWSRF